MARPGSVGMGEVTRPHYDINRNNGAENPFAGTIYESLWENNPYTNLYYEPSFWDKIGLSNKAKDTNSEYQRLYEEYIAGIYQLQEQDKYNSPANQAQLEKQAGLNPDLVGLSGAGKQGDFTSPNAGMNPALNGNSPAQSALGVITQVLGFATSTLQQIKSIEGLQAGITGQNLGNFEKFVEFARPQIVNEYAKRFSGHEGNNWQDVMNVGAMSFNSRSEQKKYKKAFQYLLGSSDFTASEQAYKNMSANDLAMKHFMSGMVDYQIQSQKYGFKSQASKGQYESSYYDGLDASSASSATNRENNNRGWLDKWRNEFYSKLYEDFKRGSDLAGLMIIASGNPTFAGIFGAGINQVDRGVSKSVSNVWDYLKKEYKDWNFKW